MALARIGNITVVKVLSQVIEDLVRGTLIPPLRWLDDWNRGFHPSLLSFQGSSCSWDPRRTRTSDSNTTSRKPSRRRPASSPTVAKQYVRSFCTQMSQWEESLLSSACAHLLFQSQASILVNSDPEVHEIAFQYGKNVGIAFQVVCWSWGTSYLHFRCWGIT